MPQQRSGYFARPLAPAPLPVLVGVVAVAGLLLTAAGKLHNDYLAIAGCVAVLVAGTAVLDATGRTEAERKPNTMYAADKLPAAKGPLKVILVVITMAVLVVNASATATPDSFGSPTPYFLAAEFLVLVMPQLLARRAMK